MAHRYIRRQLGDRSDGRKLRRISARQRLVPYLTRNRDTAEEHYRESIDVSAAEIWLSSKRADGVRAMTLGHLVVAAFVRSCSQHPVLNRFVSGYRLYSRYDLDVQLYGIGENAERRVKVRFNDNDTVMDVYHKIGDRIDNVMSGGSEDAAHQMADFVLRLPRFLILFVVALARFLDHLGVWGRNLLFSSPWHASLCLYDNSRDGLMSNATPLTNIGNISVNITLGSVYTCTEADETGRLHTRHKMDVDIAVDSRIAPKSQIETAIKRWLYYIAVPRELERNPHQTVDDEN